MGLTRKNMIIKGLRTCHQRFRTGVDVCDDCPYKKFSYLCKGTLIEEALDFIENKDTSYPAEAGIGFYGDDIYICGNCENEIEEWFNVCPKCGYAIDWTGVNEENPEEYHLDEDDQ